VRLFHSRLLAGFDRRTLRFTIRDLLWLTALVALSARKRVARQNHTIVVAPITALDQNSTSVAQHEAATIN
jgi:hypothetical protein